MLLCNPRKICLIFKRVTSLTLLSCVLIYIGASSVDYLYYTGNRPWASPSKCFTKDHTPWLIRIANKTHFILDSMGIELNCA